MKFTKMQGLGNDYVYVNCFEENIREPNKVARFVSDRHFGIGSDGLILIKPSDKADFFMEMYNADGSQSAMCGNGIRCVAKYVYDNRLTDKTNISIDTLAGIKYLDLKIKDNRVYEVTVDMGEPILNASLIPVNINKDKVIDETIFVNGKTFNITCVSMGNPHAVIFVDDVSKIDIEKIGKELENCSYFPEKANIEFVQVIDDKNVKMRVWERGTGETLACGTGSCATAVACVLNNKTSNDINVHLLGGILKIKWDKNVFMTGTATKVFDGEIDIF